MFVLHKTISNYFAWKREDGVGERLLPCDASKQPYHIIYFINFISGSDMERWGQVSMGLVN